MSTHGATVRWSRGDAAFTDARYSRAHAWHFDGGATVPASSSPHVVPLPYSDPAAVDPEEAFVASLASCHMLFFLLFAAKARWVVDSYEDAAEGVMAPNEEGRLAITEAVLRPRATFLGEGPDSAALKRLHEQAHHACFLAASVRSAIRVEPVLS